MAKEIEGGELFDPTPEQLFIKNHPKEKFMCVHVVKLDGKTIKSGQPIDTEKERLDYLIGEGIVKRIRK